MSTNEVNQSSNLYTNSQEETVRELRQDLALADLITFEAGLSNLQRIEKQSKTNPDSILPSVSIDVDVFSKKNPPKFTRIKPVFTKEAKLIIENAPYDEQAVYEITVDRSGRFSEWISIKKVS